MNKSEHVLTKPVEVNKELQPVGERKYITPSKFMLHIFYENIYQMNLDLILFILILIWTICRQYFLGNYQFSSCLFIVEQTCLPQPETASFRFESIGAAPDMS